MSYIFFSSFSETYAPAQALAPQSKLCASEYITFHSFGGSPTSLRTNNFSISCVVLGFFTARKFAKVMFYKCVPVHRREEGGVRGSGGVRGRGEAWQILRDTVNERAVRLLLECILFFFFAKSYVAVILEGIPLHRTLDGPKGRGIRT